METGTPRREWKRAKLEPCGPKGKKGVIAVSDSKMDVPEGVCVVVISRGALSLAVSVVMAGFVGQFGKSKVKIGSARNILGSFSFELSSMRLFELCVDDAAT